MKMFENCIRQVFLMISIASIGQIVSAKKGDKGKGGNMVVMMGPGGYGGGGGGYGGGGGVPMPIPVPVPMFCGARGGGGGYGGGKKGGSKASSEKIVIIP